MINITKLTQELKTAGIAFSGCNESGIVWDIDGATEIQSRKDVAIIIKAHDPTEVPVKSIREELEELKAKIEIMEKA